MGKQDHRNQGLKKAGPFIRLAQLLTDRIKPEKNQKNEKLNMQLRALSPGDPEAVRRFHVQRIASLLGSICLLAAVCIPAAILLRGRVEEVPREGLQRPGYGESAVSAVLMAEAEAESEAVVLEDLEVAVYSRQYTKEEADAFLQQACRELEGLFLGENVSEDEIRLPMVFPAQLCGGKVSAQYMTVPYGYLSEEGKILKTEGEAGQLVEIRATLQCQEESLVWESTVCLFPPALDDAARLRAQVEEEILAADEASRAEAYLALPEQAGGRTLHWMVRQAGQSRLLLAALLLLPVLLYVRSGQKVSEKAGKREEELALDYGLLLWKLTMLLNAGLTVHEAFFRIAGQADGSRYVYREMQYTCLQIRRGVSEAQAFEQFGRRCGLPQYAKLGTVLSQSLRKGTGGLGQTLEKEMEDAMTERTARARKLGEQAGTKLLFPMILMLGVVLIILILPAFMSM